MMQMFECACKILIYGVISDFDEENFDESFCLPVKCAIMLLLLLLHALVAVITTSCHMYIRCTHLGIRVLCTG